MVEKPFETIEVGTVPSLDVVKQVWRIDSVTVSLLEVDITLGQSFLSFKKGDRELTRVQVPHGYESALWGVYLMALQAVDLAQVNLGASVIVGGVHLLDKAIGEVLDSVSAVWRQPAPDESTGEIYDGFIGCSMQSLARALPHLRQHGIIVLSCSPNDVQRLDVYSTIHRKGLRVRGLSLGSKTLLKIPNLSQRLHRMMVRFEQLAEAYQSHKEELDSAKPLSLGGMQREAEKP